MSLIRVKVTPQHPSLEGKDCIELSLSGSSVSVIQVKTLLRVRLGLAQESLVRLIFQGKLLSDDSQSLDELGFKPTEQYLHAVISTPPPRATSPSHSASSTSYTSAPSTSNLRTPPPTSRNSSETTSLPHSTLRGLNRLTCPVFMAELGLPVFPLEVIEQFRVSFRQELLEIQRRLTARRQQQREELARQQDEEANDNDPLLTSDNDSQEVSQNEIEDQWLANRLPSLRLTSLLFTENVQNENHTETLSNSRPYMNILRPNGRGQYLDFFYGVLLGYFFGFILIFCLFDRNISPRVKSGIYLGIALQIVSNLAFSYSASAMNNGETDPLTSNLRGTEKI